MSLRLTAYEAQVLIGTSISGCNMSPDRVFDLKATWSRLYAMGLIDRTDGLAIATPSGVDLIANMLGLGKPTDRKVINNALKFARAHLHPVDRYELEQGVREALRKPLTDEESERADMHSDLRRASRDD